MVAADNESTSAGPARFSYAAGDAPLEGYRIVRPIHRGGFGEVFEGVSDGGKEVALKLLHSHTEIELRGARGCLNLDHPNLVTIYDIRRDGRGDWWIVMEYVPGERLSDALDRGPMTPTEAFRWLDGIASAVEHLHARGIVHRDLKPANVFEREGVVKVGDVGLAKFLSENKRSGHTRSVGTVHYMAPEVGRGKYGPGVDVYALGVLLAEMLTGKLPFDGESVAEILMRHLTEEPNLSAVEPRFRPVIAAALEKDPEKRTASCLELRDRFAAAAKLSGVTGASPAAGSVTGRVAAELDSVRRTLDDIDRRASAALRGKKVGADEEDAPAERGVVGGLFKAAWITLMVICFASPQLVGLSRPAGIAGGIFLAVALALVDGGAKQKRKRRRRERRAGVESRGRRVRAAASPVTGPETVRTVPWRQRLADVVGGSVVATLLSAVFAFVGLAVAEELEPQPLAFLTVTTAFAATALIMAGKLFEGSAGWPRRLFAAATAVPIAVVAAALSEAVLGGDGTVDLDGGWRNIDGPERFVGPLLFFAALGLVPRWWRITDPYRRSRFSLWPVLFVGGAGLFTAAVLGDPEPATVAWAFLLPVVTQLSAPWTPPAERDASTSAGPKVEAA